MKSEFLIWYYGIAFLQGFILYRSEVTRRVEAVYTSKNNLYGRKAIVVASGAWK
jgi:hypothetical protein